MLEHGGEAALVRAAQVAGNPLSTVQDFYCLGGHAQLQSRPTRAWGTL